jgi:dTDP-4-dehydrorhamnose reductase
MVWVIGANGMLGSELCEQLTASETPYTGTDVEVNILDIDAMHDFVQGKQIDIIVNCAAYTAVDKAEDEPEKTRQLNADAVGNIAEIAGELDVPVVHISTDYIFPGTDNRPLDETSAVGPESVYGKTKLQGEMFLKERWPKHYIIRTAWLYGKNGNNFVFTMLKLFKNKDRIQVVNDQFGAPTNAADLSQAIIAVIKDEKGMYGTYHFCNAGKTSWYEYAKTINRYATELAGAAYSCRIDPVTAADFGAKAPRPKFSLLSTEKYQQTFGRNVPEWEDSLKDFLSSVDLN